MLRGGVGRLDYESETFIPINGGNFDVADVAGTLDANFGSKWGLNNQHINLDCPMFVAFSAKDYGGDAVGDVSPTRRAGGMPAIAYRTTGNDGAYETGDVAPCLGTGTDPNHTTLLSGWRVRRLTPTECLRLQGFPDNYLDITFKGKPAADGPKYKAIGNSFAVNVVRWIGRRIGAVNAIPVVS